MALFPDGTRQLVVGDGSSPRTTGIFNFQTNKWRYGKHTFPGGNRVGTSLQFKHTLLSIGGYSTFPRNAISEFDPDTEQWVVRNERLSVGMRFPAATLVPQDYIPCN